MSLIGLVLFINNQEKLERERADSAQKHRENMKRYNYRKQQKNKQKAQRSKEVAIKRALK